jgi:hypothetical protein
MTSACVVEEHSETFLHMKAENSGRLLFLSFFRLPSPTRTSFKRLNITVEFEILTSMDMKKSIIWDMNSVGW